VENLSDISPHACGAMQEVFRSWIPLHGFQFLSLDFGFYSSDSDYTNSEFRILLLGFRIPLLGFWISRLIKGRIPEYFTWDKILYRFEMIGGIIHTGFHSPTSPV
jgi:hypothetical protein